MSLLWCEFSRKGRGGVTGLKAGQGIPNSQIFFLSIYNCLEVKSVNVYNVVAWLRLPKYFRSILISLQYYFWVFGMLMGYRRPNFVRPISEQREWLRTMTSCLQPARIVIPGQTLAIGYGKSRVALCRSNSFKLQQTPAFK